MMKKKYTKEELQNLSLLEFAKIFLPKEFKGLSNVHKQMLEWIDKGETLILYGDYRCRDIRRRVVIEAHRQGHTP